MAQASAGHEHADDDFAVGKCDFPAVIMLYAYMYVLVHIAVPKEEPSAEYELTRRRLESGVREMWYFFGSELKKLQKLAEGTGGTPQLTSRISHILEQGIEHKRLVFYVK
jgi:hypothetical protein